MSSLASAVLPVLSQLRVGAVARADVTRFFHEYGRKRPGGANRCHEILRTMFDCAITWGHRPEFSGNPCSGIDRYRQPPRRRLRDADELATLGAILRRFEAESPTCVAVARVILLARCRPGEIRRLRWREIKSDWHALIDAKAGPRHFLLGEAARTLLGGLAESGFGEWLFPRSERRRTVDRWGAYWFWTKACDMAGIVLEARLHDLRPPYASHAVMNGEGPHIAGRLLQHRRALANNRYVHLDDATLSQAAEPVAMAIRRKLGGSVESESTDVG